MVIGWKFLIGSYGSFAYRLPLIAWQLIVPPWIV